MLPTLLLSIHDRAAETGPPVRPSRSKGDQRRGPYDKNKNKNDPKHIVQVKLPKDITQAKRIVEDQWTQETFLGKGPVGIRLWRSIKDYAAEALHKHFWTIAHEEGLEAVNRSFPLGTVKSVDSVEDLFRWESQIVLSMMLPNLLDIRADLEAGRTLNISGSQFFWMFSCHPEWNGGKIRVLCAQQQIQTLVEDVQTAYAFKEGTRETCGSSNCFFGNIPVPGIGDLHHNDAVTRAIQMFHPGQPNAYPSLVAVRAPAKIDAAFYKKGETFIEMSEQVSELFLTLAMAQLGITPPVYAAFPVFKRNDRVEEMSEVDLRRTTHFGFAYIGEAGWSSLSHEIEKPLSLLQTAALSTAILECVRTTSNNFVLLFDVKTPNMVVRPKMDGTDYDVRMIDFGSLFSVNVNRFGESSKVPTTSSDCVFFVNGLLLLNYAYYPHQTRRRVFVELVLEVTATWYAMKELGRLDGFCAFLADDKIYADGFQRQPGKPLEFYATDLMFVEEDKFFEALSRAFYVVLEGYGFRDYRAKKLHLEEMAPPAWLATSYVERILNEMRGATGWLESDADEARLRARIDAMKEDRSIVMID